jgi:hypothetical protein
MSVVNIVNINQAKNIHQYKNIQKHIMNKTTYVSTNYILKLRLHVSTQH